MSDTQRILIADKLPSAAIDILAQEPELEADVRLGLTPDELKDIVGDYHGIIIRSGTKLTAEVIERAGKLRAIVRAGVGVDNVDVDAASLHGVLVMNTPSGNTTSTAEHTLALILSLSRHIPRACESLRGGGWNRKAFLGTQLMGKVIGLLGLGNVGLEVARLCKGIGMEVLGHDPYVSRQRAEEARVELADIDDILARADFISVHTPLTDETRGLIGRDEIAKMKPGVRIINCARGGIVDEAALAEALQSGAVAGAALDVYCDEPPVDNPLLALDNVVATPHLGALTEEAQLNVALDAARQMANALLDRWIVNAINFPALDPKQAARLQPFCLLAEKIGILQHSFIEGNLSGASIAYSGEITRADVRPVTRSLTLGLLKPALDENVNLVNAPMIAEARGIYVTESKSSAPTDFTTLLSVTVATDQREVTIEGTVFGKGDPRIVAIDGYRVEMIPRGDVLLVFNKDRPGLIGELGTLLGRANVNISGMTNGRRVAGGDAITVLNIDGHLSDELLDRIRNVRNVRAAHVVHL